MRNNSERWYTYQIERRVRYIVKRLGFDQMIENGTAPEEIDDILQYITERVSEDLVS